MDLYELGSLSTGYSMCCSPSRCSIWSKFRLDSEYAPCGILILTNFPSKFLTHCNMHPCWKNRANTKQQRTILLFFFKLRNELKKTDSKMIKENSPKLVMRITSVQQLIKCTKALSPATAPFDSCANLWSGINKIYNLIPPTIVAWLLQYSGSRVEHRDGLSSHKGLIVRFKMVNSIWILGFHKNSGF